MRTKEEIETEMECLERSKSMFSAEGYAKRKQKLKAELMGVVVSEKPHQPIVVSCITPKIVKNPVNPNYKMQCINCGETFYANRKTALYCSKLCSRQYRATNLS